MTGGEPDAPEDSPAGANTPFPGVVIGTRAQLVKMAPVLRELEARHIEYRLVFTGQHLVSMDELLAQFGVRTAPEWLGARREVDSLAKMLPWFLRSLWALAVRRRALLRARDGARAIVVVHGDTMSTLLGAVAARLNRLPIAHVESGLRSYRLSDPFPEELTRVMVFRLTSVALCPGEWATSNMRGYRARAVDTGENTLLDAVRFALGRCVARREAARERPYCVVSIHRFENIHRVARLDWILDLVVEISQTHDVEFVLHPSTAARLGKSSRYRHLQQQDSIHLRNRMGYVEFLGLLAGADFVLTDGGSNQEELYYLGVPTLVARDRSERPEGLGHNAELLLRHGERSWKEELRRIKQRARERPVETMQTYPSELVVDTLMSHEP